MTVKNYMLLVLAEECEEVMEDYLLERDFVYESIDVISIYEILKVKFPEYKNLDKTEIKDDKEFILSINRFQHLAIKSLRFGLSSRHPVSNMENRRAINELGEKIIAYIMINYISDLDDFETKKEAKKKKVWRYYNRHKKAIDDKYYNPDKTNK